MNKTTIVIAVVVLGAAGYVAYRLLGAKVPLAASPAPASTIAPEMTITPPAPPAPPTTNDVTAGGWAAAATSLANYGEQPPIGQPVLPRETVRRLTSRL